VRASDVGATLKVSVTGTKQGYATVTKTSAPTSAVAKATLSPTPVPTIDDPSPTVDQILTASPGTWGPSPVSLTFQWYKVSSSGKTYTLSGATASTYAVKGTDAGYRIKVKVSGIKAGYVTKSTTSSLIGRVAKAIFATVPDPGIGVDGTPRVGKTYSAVPGDYSPKPTTFSYQWYRGTSAISGATKASYTVTGSDLGAMLRLRVRAYRSGYVTTTRYSEQSGPIQAGLPIPATPKLNDATPTVDQMLSITNSVCPASATDPATYQWYHGSTPVPGATDATYGVRAADAGSTVKVKVSCTAPDYAAVARTSSATATVAKASFTTKGTPTIAGTLHVGQILTAEEGAWLPAPDSFAYQWYRNGSALSGKTAKTLTPASTGTYTVKVTARRAGYNSASTLAGGVVVLAG